MNGVIEDLSERRRAAKEEERKRRVADVSENRDDQEFTGEERARLTVNVARAEALGLQSAEFLKDILRRIGAVKGEALREAHTAESGIITGIGRAIAHIDVWAVDQVLAIVGRGQFGADFPRDPTSTLLPLYDREKLPEEALASMSPITIPGYGEIDPTEAVNNVTSRDVLDDWELQQKYLGHFAALGLDGVE